MRIRANATEVPGVGARPAPAAKLSCRAWVLCRCAGNLSFREAQPPKGEREIAPQRRSVTLDRLFISISSMVLVWRYFFEFGRCMVVVQTASALELSLGA